MSNQALLNKWREVSTNDEILSKDLQKEDKLLLSSFDQTMEFGTAGIRGIMGAGTSKMNIHTVSAAAQAYAQFLLANVKDAKKRGVVIGHDNRHNSSLFSETVARVLLANGIKAYLFENNDLQPTPLVSFVVRHMKLAGAAIVTASHNPKEYNGFKVYDELGGQLLPENTKKIQGFMKDIDPLTVIKSDGELSFIKQEVIEEYMKQVLNTRLRPEDKGNIKVVFTPLHGTSAKIGPELLTRMGIEHYEVTKQLEANPDFKHVKSANPEEGKAFIQAEYLARKHKADLVVATDPDADRIGMVVKYQRRWKYLNGNDMAALYLDYKLNELKRQGKLPKNGYVVKSNVSGELAATIAKKHGVNVYETHVGFKNIAALIESKPNETFILGYEESYGMLLNKEIARDKDSLQALVGIVEMTNYYKGREIEALKVRESKELEAATNIEKHQAIYAKEVIEEKERYEAKIAELHEEKAKPESDKVALGLLIQKLKIDHHDILKRLKRELKYKLSKKSSLDEYKPFNVYDHLNSLYKKYGIHRTITVSRQMNDDMMKRMLTRLSNARKEMIGDQRIVEVKDYRKGIEGLEPTNLVKVILDNGSWFALRPSGTEPKVKIYIETIGEKNKRLMDVVAFEKDVQSWIRDNSEEIVEKKFSWKGLIKYSIFIAIVLGIIALTFTMIYKDVPNADGTTTSVWDVANFYVNSINRWFWFLLFLWTLTSTLIGAWMRHRMYKMLGHKVKTRYIMASSMMASVINFITPMKMGGDVVGYWYLRRKGVDRGAVLSVIASSTVLFQVRFFLQTFIFAIIGIQFYQVLLDQHMAAFIWFMVGLSWTTFATFMITMLSVCRPFQEFIVFTAIRLLEWFRWTHIYDAEAYASKWQYEFRNIRRGMKRMWVHWYNPLEILFYSFLPVLFQPGAIMMVATGWVGSDIPSGAYWGQLVSGDIVAKANSLTITPGGAGTAELLNMWVKEITYHGAPQVQKMIDSGLVSAPQTQEQWDDLYQSVANGAGLVGTTLFRWPTLIFSSVMIGSLITLENSRFRYEKINKNSKLLGSSDIKTTKVKWYVLAIWSALIIAFVLMFFLLFY